MSDMKYKKGDKFKDKNGVDPDIEIITSITNTSNILITNGDYVTIEWIDRFYTKIEPDQHVLENHPSIDKPETTMNIEENKHHQLWKGMQSVDIMKQVLTKEEFIGFLKGQILKYQLRLGKKDSVEKDLRKIEDYTNELNKVI